MFPQPTCDDVEVMLGLIQEASTYQGKTSPNPVVGAALYKDGRCLFRAFHPKAGEPHAERLVLEALGARAQGGTLYVTLEPCSHVGRTPACSELVLRSGIARLVYGCSDPNPKNMDRRSAYQAAGIEVIPDVCKSDAQAIILPFLSHVLRKRPFVTLKVAMSLDGKIAPESKQGMYLTSEPALREVHRQRRAHDAVLAGFGTVFYDNPSLNVRYGLLTTGFKNPKKLILDPNAQMTSEYQVITENKDTQVILFSLKPYSVSFPSHVICVVLEGATHQEHWAFILAWCYRYEIQSIYIEGGVGVYQSALEAGIVDRWISFTAPIALGQGIDFSLTGLISFREVQMGRDVMRDGLCGPPLQTWL